MRLLTANWRLKLLALALTLGLLLAIAFSEDPVLFKTVSAPVAYVNIPKGLVLLRPPGRLPVVVYGLASDINSLPQTAVTATVDASHLPHHNAGDAPTDDPVSAEFQSVGSAYSLQQHHTNLTVRVDAMVSTNLDVQFEPKLSPGWTLVPNKLQVLDARGNPTKVAVSGPASLVTGLSAFVAYETPIQTNTLDIQNLTVQFRDQAGHVVDWPPVTLPASNAAPLVVGMHVEAQHTGASKIVGLRISVTGRPQCGYAPSAIQFSPGNGLATISGPEDLVTAVDSIDLGQLDISGASAPVSSTLTVRVPDGTQVAPARVTVTVQLSRVIDCTLVTPQPTSSPSSH